MSGPIVRKYGFPNFDKIFGAKPVLHGADDESKAEAPEGQAEAPAQANAESPEERRGGSEAPTR